MRNHEQGDRLRPDRFEESQRLIEGSRRILEQTRLLLNRADRVLRENPMVLYPDGDELAAEEIDSREDDNRL